MKFDHHKYTWSKPFGHVRHNWELVGPEGAVHFHVSIVDGYDPSAGLEFHHSRIAWAKIRGEQEAPHHINCPFLGGPCWHDGTSLYATETVWPIIKTMLAVGNHDGIFRFLEREYLQRFEAES